MKQPVFITGMGVISPQHSFGKEGEDLDLNTNSALHLTCIEPDYKQWLELIMVRRLSRMIKMGLVAGLQCVQDAGVENPDAIITGTALGCYESTGKFLVSMVEEEERFLTPTLFIQSTGNAVSSQIAMKLACTQYNFTYMHKGFSFESALADAMLSVAEGAAHVLVGGHEEQTESNFAIFDRLHYWKKDMPDGLLWKSKTEGTLAGEGAAFFMLSQEPGAKTYAKLAAVETIYKPENQQEIEARIDRFFANIQLKAADIDLVLYGLNGDDQADAAMHQIRNGMLHGIAAGYFKHLCGEYQTATSFALWLAANMLHRQRVPNTILLEGAYTGRLQHILIYNQYRTDNLSLILVSGV